MIDSFFDIWVELSVDGGVTWAAASEPVRMELKVDPALLPPAPAPRTVLPMPNGQYVSPQQWHQLYANGIMIRDVRHKLFTEWLEPPPFGASQTHTFESQLDFQVSLDGGAQWMEARAPGVMSVKIDTVREFGGRVTYETEVLQLDLAGGDLPAGVRIRESPTWASEGGTSMVAGGGGGGAGGGAAISSFFDIFTEVSTDGGGTWQPAATGPARMELERIAAVRTFPDTLLPPPTGEYVSPQQWHADFANGIVVSNIVHRRFTQSVPPPSPGDTLTHTFGSQVEMDVSMDEGLSWGHVSAPGTAAVRITGRPGGDGVTEYYDMEMIAWNIAGGSLPSNLMIRESPTRSSLGRTTQSVHGTDNDCDSFFDIYIEVSTDGGQSWIPAISAPVTMTLQPAGIPPLTIACPPNQVVRATRAGGAVVTYPGPLTDGGVPPISVTCAPPSGALFHVGVTPVACVAQDAAGHSAPCEFTVQVIPPARFFRANLLPPGDGMYIAPPE
jgi:hypothetical protein